MQMIIDMAIYIQSVQTEDWKLHLKSTEMVSKYFFAHSMHNYAKLMSLYLADMDTLCRSDPAIWKEFMDGNWVVNKSKLPFCALGADHALEQVNRSMKVSGGLIGITLNPSARTKFFLIAPEMANLAQEAFEMAGISSNTSKHHHEYNKSFLSRQESNVFKLITTIQKFSNPFTDECDELINLVTKTVMSAKISEDVCKRNAKGYEYLSSFVME